jgi:uncharacterized membrane protein YjjP (DUF1212 family)
MSRIECDDLQDIAVEAGALVLENGGETYRAEDTVVRVAESLGARDVHSFVTPTVVIFSWTNGTGRHFMNMKRIYRRGTNLRKIALVNRLSRELEWNGRTEDPEHLRSVLRQIEHTRDYPDWFIVLAAALSSFFFTRMFGGSFRDGLCSFCFGIVLRIMVIVLERIPLNGFIISLLAGSLVSILAELSLLVSAGIHTDIVMIGTLMQVVPGLALVNAIRDLMAGDLMAGSARLIEAIMIAGGLSVGAVSGILLAGLL